MPIGRPNVERLDARGMIEGLLRASKYKKDPEVAEQARLALERRMPLLLDTFQSKNTRHMVLARDAFHQIGQPAVPFLAGSAVSWVNWLVSPSIKSPPKSW